MKFLPLGTIIRVNAHKLCIVGYAAAEKETGSVYGYTVVSYPLGFTNIDKVFFIPQTPEPEILAGGYMTQGQERFLDLLAKRMEATRLLSGEELAQLNRTLKDSGLFKKENAAL